MTTSLKTCFKCLRELSIDHFYKHKQMYDGHLNKCKECTRADARKNRAVNLTKYREYDRARGNRQRPSYMLDYRNNNPQKYKSHLLVNNAVRDGRIAKQPCEICANTVVHAHHDDYTKPLDVRWLCPAHHRQWHIQNGEAKSA